MTSKPTGSRREGVFADNRKLPIHRWYPFIEGYSSFLVQRALDEHPAAVSIFDPFSGSGTTALTAAMRGRPSTYTEVNPYLAWVAQVKTEASRSVDSSELDHIVQVVHKAASATWSLPSDDTSLIALSQKRDYFNAENLAVIIGTLDVIDQELDTWARDLARLAVASSLVPSSNMMRRTDLRRRTLKDPKPAHFAVEVTQRISEIVGDIRTVAHEITASPRCIGTNALEPYDDHDPFDLVITSPPYLNGTNYCRNTKLELLMLAFIQSEKELELLRPAMVTAGINNVSKANRLPDDIAAIHETVAELESATYDQRVPKMVTRYFSDMKMVLKRLNLESTSGATLWLDIGDSKYSGVHVKTDKLLVDVAATVGWDHVDTEELRSRRSYDGTILSQVLLKFKKGSELL